MKVFISHFLAAYDASGKTLAGLICSKNRVYIPEEKIPKRPKRPKDRKSNVSCPSCGETVTKPHEENIPVMDQL